MPELAIRLLCCFALCVPIVFVASSSNVREVSRSKKKTMLKSDA